MKWLADRIILNIKSAYHFKKSFYTQVISMFLNNMIWLLLISLLFTQVSDIGGFNRTRYLVAYSYATLVYAITSISFGGVHRVWEYIVEGSLDRFMVTPKSPLLMALTARINVYALGDLTQAILILIFLKAPLRLLLFLPASFAIFLSFLVIVNSLYFFIEDITGQIHRQLWLTLLTFGMWPIMILPQPLKFFTYYIIPGGITFFYATENAYTGGWAPQLWLLAIIFPLIAGIMWKLGLKKYTSSNLGVNIND